jgi:ParB family transcriptional regulator, chromosome partitioning protein
MDVAQEFTQVPIDRIIVGPYNLREESPLKSPSLERLATSIWEEGLLHPPGAIDNGDGTYTLVYGHRRYWAIMHYLKDVLPTIPIRLIPKSDADELKTVRKAIAENIIRESLNPIALAKKLQLLRNSGQTNREIADDLGFEVAGSVTDVIKLLHLEPEAQEALISGKLSRSYGKALLPLVGKREQQLQALKELETLKKKARSVRTAEKIVKGIKTGRGWYELALDLPKAAKVQDLPNEHHKLSVVFTTASDLREALTYILEHNVDQSLKFHRVDEAA